MNTPLRSIRVLLLASAFATATAAAGTATLSAPGQGAVDTTGNVITVTLDYDGAAGLTAVPIKVEYDADRIQLDEVSATLGDGVTNTLGVEFAVTETGGDGTLLVDLANFGGVVGANFSGTLFTIEAAVSADSAAGDVDLALASNGDFSEGFGTATVNTQASAFTVLRFYNAIADIGQLGEKDGTVDVDVLANDVDETGADASAAASIDGVDDAGATGSAAINGGIVT